MNATRKTIEPAMSAAAKDVCGEHAEIFQADARNLMGFYITLRKLLIEVRTVSGRAVLSPKPFQCGVKDFSFSDLTKPTHDRLVIIFSYIINFVRFRESQTAIVDEHFSRAENTKERINILRAENQHMRGRLDEMMCEHKCMDVMVLEKIKRNHTMKARLLELKKLQGGFAERLGKVKDEKIRLTATLEERTEKCVGIRQKSARLRPFVLQSFEALEADLKELPDSLAKDKFHVDHWERRTRSLQSSTDKFEALKNDISSSIKLLEEISNETHKEEELGRKAAERRDYLSQRGNDLKEIEWKEGMLKRQLTRWQERIEAVRRGSDENAREAKEKMKELRREHYNIVEKRVETGTNVERKRTRIEAMEKMVRCSPHSLGLA